MVQKKMSQELIKRMIQQHGNGKLMLLLFQKLGWGEEGRKYYQQRHLLLFISSWAYFLELQFSKEII